MPTSTQNRLPRAPHATRKRKRESSVLEDDAVEALEIACDDAAKSYQMFNDREVALFKEFASRFGHWSPRMWEQAPDLSVTHLRDTLCDMGVLIPETGRPAWVGMAELSRKAGDPIALAEEITNHRNHATGRVPRQEVALMPSVAELRTLGNRLLRWFDTVPEPYIESVWHDSIEEGPDPLGEEYLKLVKIYPDDMKFSHAGVSWAVALSYFVGRCKLFDISGVRVAEVLDVMLKGEPLLFWNHHQSSLSKQSMDVVSLIFMTKFENGKVGRLRGCRMLLKHPICVS